MVLPIAASIQITAAEVTPVTAPPRAKITPAPRNPTPRDHLTEHPRRIDPGAAQDDAQSDEDLRRKADEDTGPNSNRFAPELALEADDAAADDGGRQLQGKREFEPVEHSREVFHVLTYGMTALARSLTLRFSGGALRRL